MAVVLCPSPCTLSTELGDNIDSSVHVTLSYRKATFIIESVLKPTKLLVVLRY